jgi:ABC-2 type transport system ATP-binding protein
MESDMQALLRLDSVCKDYGRVRALDNVSLTIGSGVTGLLGPNGAGKTTLIKVLLGLARITSGSGEVLGCSLGGDVMRIRAQIGYLPEDDCYVPGLTGIEAVHYAARLSRLPATEGLRRAHEILDFCGLREERYRRVETYSTGMRQKLKFAAAIVHDPPVLILDEPTAGLDPQERQNMLARIEVLARRASKAVILCTHILPDVQRLSDTVVILAAGRVRVAERLEVLCRPTSPAWHFRTLGEAGGLVDRMRGEGLDVHVAADGTISVSGAHIDLPSHLWQWARETRVGLRRVTPATNSLEEIFLQAIRKQDHAT